MFRALRTHHQKVKILLHSIWYHHTVTSELSKITKIHLYKYEHIVVKFMYELLRLYWEARSAKHQKIIKSCLDSRNYESEYF